MEEKRIVLNAEGKKILGELEVTLTHFVDGKGNRSIYIKHKGSLYPRRMHWIGNVVNMLVRGNIHYTGTPMFVDFDNLEKIECLQEPRVIASHLTTEKLPQQLIQGNGKVINISRNPKDCVVSYFTFSSKFSPSCYNGDFHSFLDYFCRGNIKYGSWFHYVKTWSTASSDYPDMEILHLRYEDLKQNLYREIVKIASFIGLSLDETLFRQIEERCSFKTMQKNISKEIGSDERWGNIGMKNGQLPIYRKGEIGEWKNWLTVDENEKFDEIIEKEFRDTGIVFKYEP